MELDSQESPGEIKRREVELDSHSRMDCLAADSFPNSCFSDTVYVTLFRIAVETAISDVLKSLRAGGVPTSLTSLFWWLLTVSSVFTARTRYNNNNGNL